MIQESYIWEQFSKNIQYVPFCNNGVPTHIVYRLFKNDSVHIYAFIQ